MNNQSVEAVRAPRPLRVVVVEDSPMLQQRLRETLAAMDGVDVLDMPDTESLAIDVIRSTRPDAIVLDLHLRQGSGFGVLRALTREGIALPTVIVFTNFDLPEYRRTAETLGVEHFLDKAREYERLPMLLQELRSAL